MLVISSYHTGSYHWLPDKWLTSERHGNISVQDLHFSQQQGEMDPAEWTKKTGHAVRKNTDLKKYNWKIQGKMFKALTNYCLLFKRLLWFLNACFEGKLSELSIYLLRMFWFIIWTKPKMCTPVILYPTNTVSFFVFKLSWCFTNLKLSNMWNELILYRLKHITLLFTVLSERTST